MNKIKKEMFTNNLFKYSKNNKINWSKTIGEYCKFIYDDIEGLVEIINYESGTQQLTIKYNTIEFKIKTNDFLSCKLGRLLNKNTKEFKIEIGTRFKDNKRDITITNREYRDKKKNNDSIVNEKWYKYICEKCGWTEGWIEESNLYKGQGCSCCRGLTVVQGINDIATTHPYLVKYFVNIEDAYINTHASNIKVLVECDNCGYKKEIGINSLTRYGFGCKKCGDGVSYPEKIMFSVLEQLNLDFQTQLSKTTFKWCGRKRYDFYFKLDGEQYICEANGLQHYEESNFTYKNGKTLDNIQDNDNLKKELALNNGIKEENYIVIDCRKSELKWIKNNKNGLLNSRLNELFDLSKIDWLKAEEFALSNLVKIACEYKLNNPNMTTIEIGNLMNRTRKTVIIWLKRGNSLDWCHYDGKEERIKNCNKMIKDNYKPVEIFKDGVNLGIFTSAKQIEIHSKELFGIQLNNRCISNVCLGKQKTHQGFTFKFTNKEMN